MAGFAELASFELRALSDLVSALVECVGAFLDRLPQGLKPFLGVGSYGTTEVVPFPFIPGSRPHYFVSPRIGRFRVGIACSGFRLVDARYCIGSSLRSG